MELPEDAAGELTAGSLRDEDDVSGFFKNRFMLRQHEISVKSIFVNIKHTHTFIGTTKQTSESGVKAWDHFRL